MGKRKIGSDKATILITTAFIFDALNIAVDFFTFGLLGIFIDAIAAIVLTLMFTGTGVSLWSSRNAGRTIVAIILDAFPVTDFTFPWTCQVAFTIFTERVSVPVMKEVVKPEPRANSGWRI